jgi:glycosyltransferase involved in cell wall biosynthesis
MSHGLPVVAADYGGPSGLIDASVGMAVPCLDPVQYAHDIAEAIRVLANDPAGTAQLGANGRRRVQQEYLWLAKLERLEQIYADVLEGGATASG